MFLEESSEKVRISIHECGIEIGLTIHRESSQTYVVFKTKVNIIMGYVWDKGLKSSSQ